MVAHWMLGSCTLIRGDERRKTVQEMESVNSVAYFGGTVKRIGVSGRIYCWSRRG